MVTIDDLTDVQRQDLTDEHEVAIRIKRAYALATADDQSADGTRAFGGNFADLYQSKVMLTRLAGQEPDEDLVVAAQTAQAIGAGQGSVEFLNTIRGGVAAGYAANVTLRDSIQALGYDADAHFADNPELEALADDSLHEIRTRDDDVRGLYAPLKDAIGSTAIAKMKARDAMGATRQVNQYLVEQAAQANADEE